MAAKKYPADIAHELYARYNQTPTISNSELAQSIDPPIDPAFAAKILRIMNKLDKSLTERWQHIRREKMSIVQIEYIAMTYTTLHDQKIAYDTIAWSNID